MIKRRCSRLVRLTLGLLWAVAPGLTQAAPDTVQYQVPMAEAPVFVTQAIDTLPVRGTRVISVMACGMELDFVNRFRAHDSSEDMAAEVLGKVVWSQLGRRRLPLAEFEPGWCTATVTFDRTVICRLFEDECRSTDEATRIAAADKFLDDPIWKALVSPPEGSLPDVAPLQQKLVGFAPPVCATPGFYNVSAVLQDPPDPSIPTDFGRVHLTFRIATACLIAQANTAILNMSRGTQQVGTDGTLCAGRVGKTHGDWDATLKDLIRVAELDRARPILSQEARTRLNDQLIDIDGGPAQERYHLWECGNEERSVGSPQERSDDRDGFDGFMEDLANTLEDLAWILLIIFLIAAAVAVTIFTAGLGGVLLLVLVSVVAAGVATAAALALVLTIPETENHLFLINTTKYLNNQYIMSNGGTGYASDQKNLREWLLEHTQRVVKADFLEYNSRPYQRYSLAAIMNLADFAKDPDVRTGAQLALEYAVAKYAISSNEGRRIVPYRRKREYLFHVDGLPHDPKKWPFNGLFDLSEGADYLHALGLLYFGPSLNLPAGGGNSYAATSAYASQAIYAATSYWRPDEAIFSLAMERGHAPLVHQRIHHDGWEIVSSGASFTITAGGVTTGMPMNTTTDGLDGTILKDTQDGLGAAVPTTLMLAGPPHVAPLFDRKERVRESDTRRSSLERFLRFDGRRAEVGGHAPSYDQNLCVWDGFACGVNLMIPDDLRACMKPDDQRPNWFLVRSDDPACPGYNAGPTFWMAIYNEPRAGNDSRFGPFDNVGLIEIVDGAEMDFETFSTRARQRNPGPGPLMGTGSACNGEYVSVRGTTGQRIGFDCVQVTSVNGTAQPDRDDWPHAGAAPGALGVAPMTSGGDGRVEITSPVTRRRIVLDFTRLDNPMFILLGPP